MAPFRIIILVVVLKIKSKNDLVYHELPKAGMTAFSVLFDVETIWFVRIIF